MENIAAAIFRQPSLPRQKASARGLSDRNCEFLVSQDARFVDIYRQVVPRQFSGTCCVAHQNIPVAAQYGRWPTLERRIRSGFSEAFILDLRSWTLISVTPRNDDCGETKSREQETDK